MILYQNLFCFPSFCLTYVSQVLSNVPVVTQKETIKYHGKLEEVA